MACIGGLFSIRFDCSFKSQHCNDRIIDMSNADDINSTYESINCTWNCHQWVAINTNAAIYHHSDSRVEWQLRSHWAKKNNRANMQIFRTSRIIFGWIGIFDANSSEVKLVYRTCLVSPLLLLLPSIAYAVANISDVSKATSAFYITCVLTMTHLKYLTYIHHKSLIRSMIIDFEAIVESSGWPNYFHLLSPNNEYSISAAMQAWIRTAFIESLIEIRKRCRHALCLYFSWRSHCQCWHRSSWWFSII